jgi:hypothetical protein
MLFTATLPVRRQVSEVLNSKIGHQIANIYAGLKGTNLSLWHNPSTPMNVLSKSPAIANVPARNEMRRELSSQGGT